MLMNQQHRVAALLIQRYNVPMPFAAEMAVRGYGRAEQVLGFSPALNQACESKDAAMIRVEMARFMTVVMRRAVPLDAATLTGLCQAGMLLPNARTKELEEAMADPAGAAAAAVEACLAFGDAVKTADERINFTVNYMLTLHSKRVGSIPFTASEQPSAKLLVAMVKHALAASGRGTDINAIAAELPCFEKLALNRGVTEYDLGLATMAIKGAGDTANADTIGVVGGLWRRFLRYAEAMMWFAMPDGTMYAPPAAWELLVKCYEDSASRNASVKDICLGLNQGWKTLVDALCTQDDTFLQCAKDALKDKDSWKVAPSTPAGKIGADGLNRQQRRDAAAANGTQLTQPRGPGRGRGRGRGNGGVEACRLFQQGRCQYGASCKFSHQAVQQPYFPSYQAQPYSPQQMQFMQAVGLPPPAAPSMPPQVPFVAPGMAPPLMLQMGGRGRGRG